MKKTLTLSSAAILAIALAGAAAPIVNADGLGAQIDANGAATSYVTSGQVSFTAPDITTPVDPGTVDPEGPTLPVQPGLLAVDYVSNLDFGSHKMSSNDQVYAASADSTYGVDNIAWHDVRPAGDDGKALGYNITVTQDDDFKDANGNTLTGAQVTLNKANVVWEGSTAAPGTNAQPTASQNIQPTTGQAVAVATAAAGQGFGQYGIKFGSASDYSADNTTGPITIAVPGATQKTASAYTTTYTWSINNTPAN